MILGAMGLRGEIGLGSDSSSCQKSAQAAASVYKEGLTNGQETRWDSGTALARALHVTFFTHFHTHVCVNDHRGMLVLAGVGIIVRVQDFKIPDICSDQCASCAG